jgi:hypothetical protein
VVEGTKIPPSKAAPLPGGDPGLDRLCMKAMSLEPKERFASAAELAQAMTTWLDQAATSPRRRLPFWQLAAFAALCAAFAGVLIWNKRTMDRREAEHREQLAETLRKIEAMKPPSAPPPGKPIVIPISGFVQDGADTYNTVDASKITFQRPCLFTSSVTLPETAEYEVTITASCNQARNEFAKFRLFVDGRQQADVDLIAERAEEYKVTVVCAAGERRIGIKFLNDFYVAKPREDRNLYVHAVTVRKLK